MKNLVPEWQWKESISGTLVRTVIHEQRRWRGMMSVKKKCLCLISASRFIVRPMFFIYFVTDPARKLCTYSSSLSRCNCTSKLLPMQRYCDGTWSLPFLIVPFCRISVQVCNSVLPSRHGRMQFSMDECSSHGACIPWRGACRQRRRYGNMGRRGYLTFICPWHGIVEATVVLVLLLGMLSHAQLAFQQLPWRTQALLFRHSNWAAHRRPLLVGLMWLLMLYILRTQGETLLEWRYTTTIATISAGLHLPNVHTLSVKAFPTCFGYWRSHSRWTA